MQIANLIHEIEYLATDKALLLVPQGIQIHEVRLNDNEVDKVREVVSNSIAESVLMWGHDRDQPEPPFPSITGYGKEVFLVGK